MDDAEYRRAEARLAEALAIFAEKEAQFSSVILGVRDNIAEVLAAVAGLRVQRAIITGKPAISSCHE